MSRVYRLLAGATLGFSLAMMLLLSAARPAVAGPAAYTPSPTPLPELNLGVRPITPWMSPQAIEIVTNGGFEAGPLGWSEFDQAGGAGSWFLFGGPGPSPLSGNPIPAPAQGAMQAITDQTGPGTHYLYQDVSIPPLSTASLKLVLWYNNLNGSFYNPPSLDYGTIPNQQFRIDIMNPAAAIDDLGAGVLLNVFATGGASPATLGYTLVSANLDAYAGQTIRLRFVEVDNQFFFNVGVDAISIQAEPIVDAHAVTWGAMKGLYR